MAQNGHLRPVVTGRFPCTQLFLVTTAEAERCGSHVLQQLRGLQRWFAFLRLTRPMSSGPRRRQHTSSRSRQAQRAPLQ